MHYYPAKRIKFFNETTERMWGVSGAKQKNLDKGLDKEYKKDNEKV